MGVAGRLASRGGWRRSRAGHGGRGSNRRGGGVPLLRKLQFLRYFGTYFGTYICHEQLWQEQELVLISYTTGTRISTRTRISLDISLETRLIITFR